MNDSLRRFVLPAYCVAFLFIFGPIFDAATNVWPWFPDKEQWRFASATILSNYIVSPIFGLLLIGTLAAATERRGTVRAVGVLSGLLAVFLLVVCISYALDTLQLRGVVQEEQVEMFKIGAAKTFSKLIASMAVTVVLAIGSFKATKIAAAGDRALLMDRGA